MSAQSQTLPQQTRRTPLVAVVAAVLAFSLGIGLSAILTDDASGEAPQRPVIVMPREDGLPDPATVRMETRRDAARARGLETTNTAPSAPSSVEPEPGDRIPSLDPETVGRLRNQARRG